MNKYSRALTLIELIIVIALLSILAAFVGWTFTIGLKSWGSGIDRANIRQDASLAMAIMMRELSQADSITDADADSITFEADIDDDGVDETVDYSQGHGANSNKLTRAVDGVDTLLSSDIQTFAVSYRDVNDALLTLPQDANTQAKRDNIRIIIISLTMEKNDETMTLSSAVFARNQ